MITGFNTDVEHDGVVYHVQTEDKGIESPLILSLVYSGGTILASKRSRYEDLIAAGFSDEVLAERLRRQHRLICAAIHAGRVDELKRMGGVAEPDPQTASADAPQTAASEMKQPDTGDKARAKDIPPPAILPKPPVAPAAAYTVHDPRRQLLAELEKMEKGLRLSLLDEHDFHGGDLPTLRIKVSYVSGNDEKPLSGVTVSVKVLGTTFKPQIYSMKTQHDGVAKISAQIPEFTSGRAAILIRVVSNGAEIELRRVIQPA